MKTFDAEAAHLLADTIRSRIGRKYQHHKGDSYTVTHVDVDEATGQVRVGYRSEKNGKIWSRTLEDFDATVPRFQEVVSIEKLRELSR